MAEQEINADELLAEIESPSEGRPMGGGEAPAAAAPAATPADWRQSFDWSIDHNGQKVSPDSADKAKTWLSLGYNYSQRAAELNKTQAELARERQQLSEKYKGYDRYGEIDQYARQNPAWWKHVEESWQQRGSHGVDPTLAPILQRLQATESVLEQYQRQQAEEAQKREDQALDGEISEIRKAYPKIDLNAVDELGRSLEYRVLKHANDNGIRSFRAAFRDYLHDQLVSEAQVSAREAIAKDTQAKAKQGVLGRSPAPTKGLNGAANVRGKSYDQLMAEGLAELGVNS